MVGGERREESEKGERERGSEGNKDVSVPFPGTWPELGGGKVCGGETWHEMTNDDEK